ncbi:MAG: DUF167 domain-containing protein [Candidatus Firestonebacteria bacterium]|nr:DUF167 domain-containing protein [Candidatus Firestonebacteria bacterium]
MALEIRAQGTAVVFGLKVIAGARKTQLAGEWNGSLKIKVNKIREDGAANRECLALLADTLGVLTRQVKIVQGEFSPLKVVRIEGVSPAAAREKLTAQA